MNRKFNLNREKLSDAEIERHKDFDNLVEQFKKQSLKQARGDESWWKNKKITYTTVIAGVTVICTITIASLFKKPTTKHEVKSTTSSTHNTQKQKIQPPMASLQPRRASYKVNSNQGAVITHSTNSRINIPADAFLNKQGQVITGDVTIEYREYHDLAEIMLSGVPMHYDTANTRRPFESAGMFEITGTKDGQPVYIDPKNPITVELASTKTADRYQQYYFDTVAGQWNYMKHDNLVIEHPAVSEAADEKAAVSNPKAAALSREIKEIPKKVDSVKVVYGAKQRALSTPAAPTAPQRATPGRPTFVLDANMAEFPELSAFDNVIFEVGPENKNYRKELHDITWSNVKISEGPVKGKNYLLTLILRSKSEQLVVYPVLGAADYANAEKKYNSLLADYQQKLEKKEREEKRLMDELKAKEEKYLAELKQKQEAYDREVAALAMRIRRDTERRMQDLTNTTANDKLRRVFQVSQWGIYNSDCAQTQGTSVMAQAFTSGGKTISPTVVYLADLTASTITSQDQVIRFDPNHKNILCVVMKNRMFKCDESSFARAIASKENRFQLTEIEATEDFATLKKSLGI